MYARACTARLLPPSPHTAAAWAGVLSSGHGSRVLTLSLTLNLTLTTNHGGAAAEQLEDDAESDLHAASGDQGDAAAQVGGLVPLAPVELCAG